ncbi:MAG: CBS domain-containing protein, partial [Tepidiformaceae bacterium]
TWLLLGLLGGDMYAPLLSRGSPMAVTASYNMLLLLVNVLPLVSRDGYRAYSAILWSLTGDRVRGGKLAAGTGPVLVALAGLGLAAYLWVALDEPEWAITIAVLGVFELRGSLGGSGVSGDRIHGLSVSDLMSPGLRARPDALARSLVDDRTKRKYSPDISRHATLDLPYVVITDNGELLGMLTPGEVEQLALRHLQWDTVTVAEVMTPAAELPSVFPEAEGFTALVYMMERQLEALLVVDGGEPVGCITARRLMEALEDEPAGRRQWRPRATESIAPGPLPLADTQDPGNRSDAA